MLQGIARVASQGHRLDEIQNVSDDTVIAN